MTFIKDEELEKWKYLKGAKREYRKDKSGFEYFYTEGGMIFPEPMDKPSRTIITGEGGRSPSRFKHVIDTKNGLRRLIPMELERLNMFPDNFTEHEEVSHSKRAFIMGNALVIGVVEKLGESLAKRTKVLVTSSIAGKTLWFFSPNAYDIAIRWDKHGSTINGGSNG